MKFHARAGALLLCLLLVAPLCLAGCGNGKTEGGIAIPAGMQDATGTGAGYSFFVPSDWIVDQSTGITMATPNRYSTACLTLAVFASDRTPAEYWAAGKEDIAAKFTDYTLDEDGENQTVGGQPALRSTFGGTYYTGTAYRLRQYVAKHEGRMFVFTYAASDSEYERYERQVSDCLAAFLYEGIDVNEPPRTLPEPDADGMRLLTDPRIHACAMRVPAEWTVDLYGGGLVSAYVSDEDRTSVSLTCHAPGEGIENIGAYVEALQKPYEALYHDYVRATYPPPADSGEEKDVYYTVTTLAGTDAARYEFSGENGGVRYRVAQYFFVHGSLIYTVTYTAQADRFEAHEADLSRILATLSFD